MPQSKRHPARRPQQRPARPSHRNPATPPAPVPAASGARRTLERLSVRPLLVMHALPTWVTPTVLAVLLVAGLAVPASWAGVLLLLPALFLCWLLALSWPVLTPRGRLFRLSAVMLLLAAAVARLGGMF